MSPISKVKKNKNYDSKKNYGSEEGSILGLAITVLLTIGIGFVIFKILF